MQGPPQEAGESTEEAAVLVNLEVSNDLRTKGR